MKRRVIKIICTVLFTLISFVNTYAETVTDYLITQNLGDYNYITQAKDFVTGQIKTIPGYIRRTAPGILAGAAHFDVDHDDITYETNYVNKVVELSVDVQVTQHAGAESDKWLLHEVEDIFRSNERLGELIAGTEVRNINENNIYNWISYAWVSNNVVIYITWTPKPNVQNIEPLEIIQAYLQKFPSIITLTDAEVKSNAHNEKWIKDEMERRLWLGDKWFMALQLGKVEQAETFRQTVKSMNVFLDYREKYYSISAKDEKNLLDEYITQNNGAGIKAKLAEFKEWWTENKENPINLP